jgi:uncharacterized circularly permuted ATP-grasp superfamily protein
VADDKVVYAWVPDLIRYYLDEEPIIPNVPTFRCHYERERRHVLDNLRELVVKPANESGGYGLVIGDRATGRTSPRWRGRSRRTPGAGWRSRSWRCPRRPPVRRDHRAPPPGPAPVRPHRRTSYVTRGGLTRVALQAGSLVVNSSQGGGSKDTWVVEC